jgi:hypothetical protein
MMPLQELPGSKGRVNAVKFIFHCDANFNSQILTYVYSDFMTEMNEKDAKTLHDIMQPLNIIRLSCGNMRARIGGHSTGDTEYLLAKVTRIEEQVVRAAELLQDLKKHDDNDGIPEDA